jgi:hypothetical protein
LLVFLRRGVKTKTKIHLLAMSKAEKEKRPDALNQQLGITHPNELTETAKKKWKNGTG